MSVVAIIAAAGSGTRLGSQGAKALVELGGIPLIVHAVRSMERAACIDRVVVSAPADSLDSFHQVLSAAGYADDGDFPVTVVAGGETRQASVSCALDASGDCDYVLIHDAARPLTPPEVIERVVSALQSGERAVIPAIPVVDTIKEVCARGEGSEGAGEIEEVVSTPQRAKLRAVQTPQGFDTALLRDVHAQFAERASSEENAVSDDATLVEQAGEKVAVVAGSERSLKITHPLDLSICGMLFLEEHFTPHTVG